MRRARRRHLLCFFFGRFSQHARSCFHCTLTPWTMTSLLNCAAGIVRSSPAAKITSFAFGNIISHNVQWKTMLSNGWNISGTHLRGQYTTSMNCFWECERFLGTITVCFCCMSDCSKKYTDKRFHRTKFFKRLKQLFNKNWMVFFNLTAVGLQLNPGTVKTRFFKSSKKHKEYAHYQRSFRSATRNI